MIFDFTANDYAWYFEMYIGLFLLIPFLNLAYSGLKSKRHKLLLIGILFFLTMMPEVMKSFAPFYKDGGVALDIIPDFFKDLYPVTYYFIGAYICEYKPKFKAVTKVLSLIIAPLIPFALCMIFSYTRGSYAWYMMNGNGAPTSLFTALAIFLSLYDIDFKPGKFSGFSRIISECTFEMYLFSFIFDAYVYGPGNMPARLERYFSQFGIGPFADGAVGLPFVICVIFIFAGSFIAAYIIRKIAVIPIARSVKRISGGKTENYTK
jgi:surface polysaccharide O-acyltransferase-like enzyme